MNWWDRWAARMQRNADRRDLRYRQRREAVRAGTRRPRLSDRLEASGRRQVQADNQQFEQLCELIQLLASGPVSGADGVPILICLSDQVILRPLKLPLPEVWLHAFTVEPTVNAQAARIMASGRVVKRVYAYALSGPPRQVSRRFRYSYEAIAYALSLAKDIQSQGVDALR